jgi:hypothetical protein
MKTNYGGGHAGGGDRTRDAFALDFEASSVPLGYTCGNVVSFFAKMLSVYFMSFSINKYVTNLLSEEARRVVSLHKTYASWSPKQPLRYEVRPLRLWKDSCRINF